MTGIVSSISWGPSLRCKLYLDLRNPLFVNRSDSLSYVALRRIEGDLPILLATMNANEIHPWDLSKKIPINYRGFQEIWNFLATNPKIARIESVTPDKGIAFVLAENLILARMTGNTKDVYSFPYEIEVIGKPYTVLKQTDRHVQMGIVLRSNLKEKLDRHYSIQGKRDAVDAEFAERVETWERKQTEVLTSGRCYSENVARWPVTEDYVVIIIPVKVNYEKYNWIHEWFVQAGIDNISTEAAQFDEKFPALFREAAGFENISLNELEKFLQYRIENVPKNISIMDIDISFSILRSFGVIFVVFLQAYAIVHLYEVRRRMAYAARGDTGAFQPWILLYHGAAAGLVSVLFLVSPTMATLMVLFSFDTVKSIYSTPLGISCFVLMVVSLVLTCVALWNARELRRTAIFHRRAPLSW